MKEFIDRIDIKWKDEARKLRIKDKRSLRFFKYFYITAHSQKHITPKMKKHILHFKYKTRFIKFGRYSNNIILKKKLKIMEKDYLDSLLRKYFYNLSLFTVRIIKTIKLSYDLLNKKYQYLKYKKLKTKFGRIVSRRKWKLFWWKKKIHKKKLKFFKKLIFYRKKEKKGIIHLRSTNSNYFLTLTDLNFKLLYTGTTGQVCKDNSKKKKVSPLLIPSLLYRVIKILRDENIKILRIHLRSKITRHVYNVVKFLKKGGYSFEYIAFLKPQPHHFGFRKKKQRRI